MSSVSGTSDVLRFSGLASGLDTDSIIKQLMKVERMSVDKVKQKKQSLEWKRDNYRDITNLLRGFKDDYFSFLKPLNNMKSAEIYNKFATDSSDKTVATATAGAGAIAGTHNLTVTALATAAKVNGGPGVTKTLTGTAVPTQGDGSILFGANNQFTMTLDGLSNTIQLQNSYANLGSLTTDLNQQIQNAFGAGKVSVTDNGSSLTFAAVPNTSKIVLASASSNDALGQLGFTSGASNRLNTSEQLSVLKDNFASVLGFNGTDLTFTINNVNFTVSDNETLNDLMNKINSSSAGVEIRYSEVTDNFTITAKQKGTGNTIDIINTGGTFFGNSSSINIAAVADETSVNNLTVNAGTDLSVNLDGTALTRNSNTFTVDGVTYNITANDPATLPKTTNITINKDVDGIFNSIKSFVDKYNEVIDTIQKKLTEERFRNYQPLTDDQKSEMKDEEIKQWEEKAKSGLLKDDPLLKKILSDLRGGLFAPITGVDGIITDIGVNTGNWQDRGKLVIDESKLKDALQNSPDKVSNFFSKSSSIAYSPNLTAADRQTRFDESGLIQRFSDVIEENIRTTRNTAGQKGVLLEKAGLVGDVSEYNNIFYQQINEKDKEISNLLVKMTKKENNYYKKFTAMEKAIAQMNSQGSWLTQQMGGQG